MYIYFSEVAEKLQFLVTQEKLELEWDPDDRIELNEPINFGRVWMLLASVESKLGHLTTAQRWKLIKNFWFFKIIFYLVLIERPNSGLRLLWQCGQILEFASITLSWTKSRMQKLALISSTRIMKCIQSSLRLEKRYIIIKYLLHQMNHLLFDIRSVWQYLFLMR